MTLDLLWGGERKRGERERERDGKREKEQVEMSGNG